MFLKRAERVLKTIASEASGTEWNERSERDEVKREFEKPAKRSRIELNKVKHNGKFKK